MSKKPKNTLNSFSSIPLVYSTNPDYIQPSEDAAKETLAPAEQMLRVILETKHRAGKTVTIVYGFEGAESDLEVLEKDTNGKVVNYKFEVDYDKENNILFNYKIKRGISRQYIALDLLKKNNFDEDIIKDAIEMCNKLKNKTLENNKTENKKKKDKKHKK